MSNLKQVFLRLSIICAGAALFLCSGCVTVTPDIYGTMVAYKPVRSPVQIDASASFEAVDNPVETLSRGESGVHREP